MTPQLAMPKKQRTASTSASRWFVVLSRSRSALRESPQPQFWIEQARQIGRSRAARPSVQVDDGGAARRAVLAHGQLVLGADGERVGREGLLSRVKARHWFLLDNSSKVNVRMCEPHVHCVPDPPAAC